MSKLRLYLLSITIISSLFLSIPNDVYAGTYSTSTACEIHWYVNKPGYDKPVESSYTVYKNQKTGYSAQLDVKGTTCGQYAGQYILTTTPVAAAKPKTAAFKEDCQALANHTITLDYSTITAKTIYLTFWVNADVAQCNEGKTNLKALTITATMSDQDAPAGQPTDTGGGGTTNDPAGRVENIHNPVSSETFLALAFRVMKYLLAAIAGIAIVFIMFGALELMASRGNPEMVTRGKETILWAVVGLAASLFSFSIIAMIKNILTSFFGGS